MANSEDKRLPKVAEQYTQKVLKTFTDQAQKSGHGLYYELFSQTFTNQVNGLLDRVKNERLRDHILSEARNTSNYVEGGHWSYDTRSEDVVFHEDAAVKSPAASPAVENSEAAAKDQQRKQLENLLHRATTPSKERAVVPPPKSQSLKR